MQTHTTVPAQAVSQLRTNRQTTDAGGVSAAALYSTPTNTFVDNSNAALTLQRFQQLANKAPVSIQLKRQSEMMAASPEVLVMQSLQNLPDNSPQASQLKARAAMMPVAWAASMCDVRNPVQRNVDKEILQGNSEQAAENEKLLQGKLEQAPDTAEAGTAPVQLAEKPNHTGLPNQLKSGIESLSGMSMDHVKVHYNSNKPAQLQAHAYAQGSEIHVAPGQEQHLPHEVWHVVQQAQGRVRPTMQMKGGVVVNDDVGLEREADVMGLRALSGAQSRRKDEPVFALPSSSQLMVQRFVIETHLEYQGFLSGQSEITNPAKVHALVAYIQENQTVPNLEEPMTAQHNVAMVGPDNENVYTNILELGEDPPESTPKNVLTQGHHRLAACAEIDFPLPAIVEGGYAATGYHWNHGQNGGDSDQDEDEDEDEEGMDHDEVLEALPHLQQVPNADAGYSAEELADLLS